MENRDRDSLLGSGFHSCPIVCTSILSLGGDLIITAGTFTGSSSGDSPGDALAIQLVVDATNISISGGTFTAGTSLTGDVRPALTISRRNFDVNIEISGGIFVGSTTSAGHAPALRIGNSSSTSNPANIDISGDQCTPASTTTPQAADDGLYLDEASPLTISLVKRDEIFRDNF